MCNLNTVFYFVLMHISLSLLEQREALFIHCWSCQVIVDMRTWYTFEYSLSLGGLGIVLTTMCVRLITSF